MSKKKLIFSMIGGVLLVGLITTIVITQFLQISRLKDLVNEQNQAFYNELTTTNQSLDLVKQNTQLLQSSVGSVRRTLLLPEAEYLSMELQTEESDDESDESEDDVSLYFRGIDKLVNHNTDIEQQARFNRNLTDESFKTFFHKEQLTIAVNNGTSAELHYQSGPFLTLQYSAEDDTVEWISSADGSSETVAAALIPADFVARLKADKTAFNQKITELKTRFRTIYNITLKDLLKENSLYSTGITEDSTSLSLPLYNQDETMVSVFRLDLQKAVFFLNDQQFSSLEEMENSFYSTFSSLDIRTRIEKNVDESLARLKSISIDPAFNTYLDSMELSFHINEPLYEDNDYFYARFKDYEDNPVGSFGVLKSNGEIYLLDGRDIPVTSLKTIAFQNQMTPPSNFTIPDNLPTYSAIKSTARQVNILLCGAHENNVDTIMIAHADLDTGEAALISIPRDLYWKGKKINSIYNVYGPQRLMSELTEITGLDIQKYVVIDMYAFIDVIDILGGIEVTLNEALIDESMKIVENGIQTTLNYPAGTHKLNGIGALRIARSRHSTNDFDRSNRQQMIIDAMMDKLTSLGVADMGKVYDLFNMLFQYVDTNMPPLEMADLFMKYKDVSIATQTGLNTGNILESTYSNVYRLTDKSIAEEPGFRKGLWILLPKENDWNVIKWFIHRTLKGEAS